MNKIWGSSRRAFNGDIDGTRILLQFAACTSSLLISSLSSSVRGVSDLTDALVHVFQVSRAYGILDCFDLV